MKPVNTSDLLKQAKASEHKEAYQIMNKTANYRVGVGARLPLSPTQTSSFFIEIIVNLCPACSKVDLVFLEKALTCLKELQKNGYSLTCQDDNCISCEKLVQKENIDYEYNVASKIMKQSFP
jgi:hypothetical protein